LPMTVSSGVLSAVAAWVRACAWLDNFANCLRQYAVANISNIGPRMSVAMEAHCKVV